LKSLLKRSGFLIGISALIAVNLVIQIVRFNSYTLFMKGLNLDVSVTALHKTATSVDVDFLFNLSTNEKDVHAFVSGIQFLLTIGKVDLGYHPIVGAQDMMGSFERGKFRYKTTINFSGDQMVNLLKYLGKKKMSYKAYVEIHVVQGKNDMRSVPLFSGYVREAFK